MEQAIEAYKQVTVLPEFKEAERLRQKARLDEAQALQNAEKRGKAEGKLETAMAMLAEGIPPEIVAKCAKLPLEKVLQLKS